MTHRIRKTILKEIDTVLCKIDDKEVSHLVDMLVKHRKGKIVCSGAGRVGNAIWGFAMRLGHLGFSAHCVGDSTTPSIGKKDMLIVASGSGETETIHHLAKTAKAQKSHLALVTANKDSRMGRLADSVVVIPAPSKTRTIKNFKSIQPMTTLNEQCLQVFFDSVVIELMEKLHIKEEHMWDNHSKLE